VLYDLWILPFSILFLKRSHIPFWAPTIFFYTLCVFLSLAFLSLYEWSIFFHPLRLYSILLHIPLTTEYTVFIACVVPRLCGENWARYMQRKRSLQSEVSIQLCFKASSQLWPRVVSLQHCILFFLLALVTTAYIKPVYVLQYIIIFVTVLYFDNRLCGLVVSVCCEVRTEFIYVM
jgi:hypothetical protein